MRLVFDKEEDGSLQDPWLEGEGAGGSDDRRAEGQSETGGLVRGTLIDPTSDPQPDRSRDASRERADTCAGVEDEGGSAGTQCIRPWHLGEPVHQPLRSQ